MSENKEKVPIVFQRKDGTIDCPFCGKTHKHGYSEGYRIAHCANTGKPNKTYYLSHDNHSNIQME